ncbi:MAG: hypothetical protein ACK44F_16295, partial [Roseococcus sp.]
MIPVAEARARILAGIRPVSAETVPLAAAAGRVLAAPVRARVTQPPADVSAMDGYALRAAEANAGAALRVVGTAGGEGGSPRQIRIRREGGALSLAL